MKMMAAYLEKPLEIKVREVDIPEIKTPADVLVRIAAAGICGSDVHYYREGRIGDFIVRKPMILGHEAAGIIEKVGKNVKDLKEGDRVAIEPGIPCRKCDYCKTGSYNLCPEMKFFATPPVDGIFCEYAVHPGDFVYRLPDNMTVEEAPLLEPCSVGIHACRLAQLQPGETVLVSGLGPVGMLTLQTAIAFGAKVCGLEKNSDRLALAARWIHEEKLFDTSGNKFDNIRKTLASSFDAVLECSGATRLTDESTNLVKRGGRIVFVGMGKDAITLNAARITSGEISIKGLFRYANTYKTAIRLFREGRIELAPLISKKFPLGQVKEALEYPGTHPECIKAIIMPAL